MTRRTSNYCPGPCGTCDGLPDEPDHPEHIERGLALDEEERRKGKRDGESQKEFMTRVQARLAEVIQDEFGIDEMFVQARSESEETDPIATGEGGIGHLVDAIANGMPEYGEAGEDIHLNLPPEHKAILSEIARRALAEVEEKRREDGQHEVDDHVRKALCEAAYMQGGALNLPLIPLPLLQEYPDLEPCGCFEFRRIVDDDTGARLVQITPVQCEEGETQEDEHGR